MGRPCRLLLQALYPYGTTEHPRTRPIHLGGSGCVDDYSRTDAPEASGDWRDTLVQALLPASCWIEEFSLYGNDEPFEWEAPPHECVCCACCKLGVSGSDVGVTHCNRRPAVRAAVNAGTRFPSSIGSALRLYLSVFCRSVCLPRPFLRLPCHDTQPVGES